MGLKYMCFVFCGCGGGREEGSEKGTDNCRSNEMKEIGLFFLIFVLFWAAIKNMGTVIALSVSCVYCALLICMQTNVNWMN